ncbi:FAD-dependent monooxygenase [Nannocystis radixulma]|uniref:FAD-dependent monooxygenase n=1 Tax=Nannocystis radixulma TaxID=2995305 RepID=A0ABT5B3C3_9BACT|nr:FAD-dependent monooxygenase [Nannocystis radixulma]MDC0668581.1 FAD-dependent monooxygenase [Nannocystis radixulma]
MTNSATTRRRRVLVVGLGISGIATALRLHRLGWEPVIIERAAGRRRGGYAVALFGTGVASATRLGVLDAVGNRLGPPVQTFEIDRSGRRRKGMGLPDLPGGPRLVLRGDVENALYSALPADLEIRFATSPVAIAQDERGVDVTMSNSATGATTSERFDLVVGADGLRSTVRKLVFGPHERFMHPMNYMIGACVLSRPIHGHATSDGLVMAEAGRSAWVFPFVNHNPTVLFSYRVDDVAGQFRRPAIDSVRAAFAPEPAGPVLSQLFDDYAAADERLFDSVEQVRMERWHEGRVVLLGDAAWCLTLYSGMGASTGMAGGELLGNMLEKHPDDLRRALFEWEAKLRPFTASLQQTAMTMRQLFTPSGELQRILRAAIIRLSNSPVAPIFKRLVRPGGLTELDIVAA